MNRYMTLINVAQMAAKAIEGGKDVEKVLMRSADEVGADLGPYFYWYVGTEAKKLAGALEKDGRKACLKAAKTAEKMAIDAYAPRLSGWWGKANCARRELSAELDRMRAESEAEAAHTRSLQAGLSPLVSVLRTGFASMAVPVRHVEAPTTDTKPATPDTKSTTPDTKPTTPDTKPATETTAS